MARLSARQLGADLARGKIDPVALVEETYALIDADDDQAVFIDLLRPRAMAEAEAARIRLRAGLGASPLDGVPIAWKDLFDVKGNVTKAGSVVLGGQAPAHYDADLVAAAATRGLVSVGTLNMTEFAYSGIGLNPHYGTPRNPHGSGEARAPGGSSSGSGVAVARSLVTLAIGTDTGGSVRIPASFNGVVGYKSSTGHYPMGGVYPLSQTFDTLGPFAGDVPDIVLIDAVLRRADPVANGMTALAGISLIVPETLLLNDCQDAVRNNFEASLDRLGKAGAQIRRFPVPALAEIPQLIAGRGHAQAAEALAVHWGRVHGADAAQMDARVVRRLLTAEKMSAVDLVVFHQERARLIAETNELFGASFIVCPTTPHVAMPIAPLEEDQDLFFQKNALTLRNTMVGNFLDWCGVSIPNGTDQDGMPTGFLVSATHGRDAALLSAALVMEGVVRV